jgi:regulator of sirC expression with transglutaminase-like and TPR domain
MTEKPLTEQKPISLREPGKEELSLAEKMLTQQEAIVKLLQDNDPDTVRMVKEQLAQGGETLVPGLQDLARMDDERVSLHAREILTEIAVSGTDEDLLLLCHFFPDEGNFENAYWMISRALGATPDLAPYERKIDQWGRRFHITLSGAVSDREKVLALADFMAGELCFRGNTDNYYCERNSLLPTAIDMRMGIPITLTLLYIMVARRAGMDVEGINLPGHFIARHGDVLFDPFHKGRILTRSDCGEILARQNLKLRPSYFLAARPRQIILRILANFLYVYDLHNETGKHDRVRTWMKALTRDDS